MQLRLVIDTRELPTPFEIDFRGEHAMMTKRRR
jgi:hypothetical protein